MRTFELDPNSSFKELPIDRAFGETFICRKFVYYNHRLRLTDLDGNCKLFFLKLILSLAPLIPRAHPDQFLDMLEVVVGVDDNLLEVEVGDVLLEVAVGDVLREVAIDDDVFYSLLPC